MHSRIAALRESPAPWRGRPGATRSISPLPTELPGVDPGTAGYWYIGRNWVWGEGSCGGASCLLYLNLGTGELVVSSSTMYDLDAPTAQPLDDCRRDPPGWTQAHVKLVPTCYKSH